MYTNDKATLYAYNKATKVYTRVPLGTVFWEEVKTATYMRTGLTGGAMARVFVPHVTGRQISADGYSRVVRGDIAQEIADGYTITDLVNEHDAMLITTCDAKLDGSPHMRHWEVGLK